MSLAAQRVLPLITSRPHASSLALHHCGCVFRAQNCARWKHRGCASRDVCHARHLASTVKLGQVLRDERNLGAMNLWVVSWFSCEVILGSCGCMRVSFGLGSGYMERSFEVHDEEVSLHCLWPCVRSG